MGIFERLKRFTRAVARITTRVLLAVGLFLIYVLAIGPTSLCMMVFARSRFASYRVREKGYWTPADGYAPDLPDAERQS